MQRIACSVALALMLGGGLARAQSPDVATVAGWAQTFLSDVGSLDVRFQQDSWAPAQRRTTTSHGRLRARADHVRFDYDGNGLVVVANGDRFLYYQPGDASFPGQVTHGTSDAVSAAFSVLVGGAPLARDYEIAACASVSSTAPVGSTCIELRPRGAHASFELLRMYVLTAEEESRGRPARLSVELHDGTWNTFTFDDMHVGASIGDDVFAFEPPAGTREL